MKIANGARIHASNIKPGMRVKNIVHAPWEAEITYDVDSVDTVVLEGTRVYAINGTDGARGTNAHGYWMIADVPAEGTVTTVRSLPLGTYVTVMGINAPRRGHITGPGVITGYHNELTTDQDALAVVGEHYDATGTLMLPVGPARIAA